MREDENILEQNEAAVIYKTQSGGQINVSVAFRAPRKRTSKDDTVRWTLGIYSFLDGNHFMGLDAVFSQLQPGRVFVVREDVGKKSNARKLRTVIETSGADIEELTSGQFNRKVDDVRSELSQLLGEETLVHYDKILENASSIRALGALSAGLRLLYEMNQLNSDRSTPSVLFELKHCSLDTYMRLDSSALRALHILPETRQDRRRPTNLFGLLNQCVTNGIGPRLLERWLRQPLCDMKEIIARQSIIELFYENDMLRQTLREGGLGTVPDLRSLVRRFDLGKAGLKHLYEMYLLAERMPDILNALKSGIEGDSAESDEMEVDNANKEANRNLLKTRIFEPLKKVVNDLMGLKQLVEHVLDFEAVHLLPPQYLVNPVTCAEIADGDSDLVHLKDRMDEAMEEIEEEFENAGATWGKGVDLKLERDRHYGYCIRVPRSKMNTINKNGKKGGEKPETLKILKGGVFLTTRHLRKLAEKYKSIYSEYNEAQKEVTTEAVRVAATYLPVLDAATITLADLDVLLALAHVAAHTPSEYCKPKLSIDEVADTKLILKNARHPCVEMMDDVDFIPNDYTLKRRSEQNENSGHFMLVTGPNMGGKSTYIRQLGTIVVMAQIGSFVPAEYCELSLIDSILCRVGAGDCQLKGVSTFMAEMLEASSILQVATEKSLVIIDELGRGTSTYDGFGLAWSIALNLSAKRKCFGLFATHFHELTALADQVNGVFNRHVTAHTTDKTITMMYQVSDGACDRSYGIHVAELAQFPPCVVADARRKVEKLEAKAPVSSGKRKREVPSKEASAKMAKFIHELKRIPLVSMGEGEVSNNSGALSKAKDLIKNFKMQCKESEENSFLRKLIE
eukprot:g3779.t1